MTDSWFFSLPTFMFVSLVFKMPNLIVFLTFLDSDTVQRYTEPLASLLALLQESIYASQLKSGVSHKEAHSPLLPPTEAYARLKNLLGDISEKAFHLTPLRPFLVLHLEEWITGDCPSYEHLLANAVVNQVGRLVLKVGFVFIYFFVDCRSKPISLSDHFLLCECTQKRNIPFCGFLSFFSPFRSLLAHLYHHLHQFWTCPKQL